MLPGRQELGEALKSAESLWSQAFEAQDAEGRPQPQRMALRNAEDMLAVWERSPRVYAEPLVMGAEKSGTDLPERRIASFDELFPTPAEQDRPWQTLVQALKRWQGEKRQVLLSFASDKSRAKFLNLAAQDGLSPSLRYDPEQKGLFALVASFRSGAELVWDERFFSRIPARDAAFHPARSKVWITMTN